MSDFDPDEVILDPRWKRQDVPQYKFRWRHDDIVWVYDEITNNAYHVAIVAVGTGDDNVNYMVRLLPGVIRNSEYQQGDHFIVPHRYIFDTEQEARRHIHYAGHG